LQQDQDDSSGRHPEVPSWGTPTGQAGEQRLGFSPERWKSAGSFACPVLSSQPCSPSQPFCLFSLGAADTWLFEFFSSVFRDRLL